MNSPIRQRFKGFSWRSVSFRVVSLNIFRDVLHSLYCIVIEWFPLPLSVFPSLTAAKCHWERMDTLGKRKHRTSRKSMTSKMFWERKYKNIYFQLSSCKDTADVFISADGSRFFLTFIIFICSQLCYNFGLRIFFCWPMWTWYFPLIPSACSWCLFRKSS